MEGQARGPTGWNWEARDGLLHSLGWLSVGRRAGLPHGERATFAPDEAETAGYPHANYRKRVKLDSNWNRQKN